MSEKPTYYDNRSEFWKTYWNLALPYEEYLVDPNNSHVQRWMESAKRMPKLSKSQIERLQGYDRKLNVLMYSGIWCGDCVRQGPLLKKLVDTCGKKVNLKIIERDISEELQDELRILGALRVPVIVFLTEDFWEIQRFGERTLSVYKSKMAREIGRGNNDGILSPKARDRELSEWVDIFERVLIMTRLSPPLRRRHKD
ncbi:MAG: thioredoxin family protein [Candidatus Ranarchaeia archaeon]|jgi:thiol-disulfide isomerase/thioredoxin